MATIYYNNAVDENLDTVGNWWTSNSFATPMGRIPTTGDDAILGADTGESSCNVTSGTLTCDTATFDLLASIEGGTFNCNVLANNGDGDQSIIGGVFNGTVHMNYENAFIDGGTFNGNVTHEDGVRGRFFGGVFNGDLTLSLIGWIQVGAVPIVINGRLLIRSETTLYAATADGVAGAGDVRDGVFNLGVEGTLGGGEINITVY